MTVTVSNLPPFSSQNRCVGNFHPTGSVTRQADDGGRGDVATAQRKLASLSQINSRLAGRRASQKGKNSENILTLVLNDKITHSVHLSFRSNPGIENNLILTFAKLEPSL